MLNIRNVFFLIQKQHITKNIVSYPVTEVVPLVSAVWRPLRRWTRPNAMQISHCSLCLTQVRLPALTFSITPPVQSWRGFWIQWSGLVKELNQGYGNISSVLDIHWLRCTEWHVKLSAFEFRFRLNEIAHSPAHPVALQHACMFVSEGKWACRQWC